jgi:co-chaperonin GroES (HSP10)
MKKQEKFPTDAYGDSIIIERLDIMNRIQKKTKAAKLVLGTATPPKNIMDIEKRKAEEISTYEDAQHKMLEMWDEHPHQGIVMSVGSGRNLGNGNFLTPTVKVGQHILYRGNAGEPMIINKKLYWLIHDNEIYSIVPDPELIK